MAALVKEDIVRRVGESGVWVLLADETTDCSNREQMALVVRYIDSRQGELVVREDPIGLVDVFKTLRPLTEGAELRMSGVNLARVITAVLNDLRLDRAAMVAQCYDGAACMASERVGVAAQMRCDSPLARYFHCAVHALNLATSQLTKVDIIRNALGSLETVVTFLTDGAKREELLRTAQKEALGDGEKRKLLKLCQTRFVERHVAVERFWEELPAVCLALELMAEWQDRRTSSQAANLLNAVTQGEFLDMRTNSDTEFENLMVDATAMAAKFKIEIKKPRLPSRAAHRSTAAADQTPEAYYRVNTFVPALDAVISNIRDRFGVHQRTAFLLSRLLPKNVSDSTWEQLEPVFRQYASLIGACTEQLRSELRVWSAMWSNRPKTEPEVPLTAIGTLNECSQCTFPAIHRLLRVLAVLPATTAEAERLFSKVTRTLTALRSTMTEDRLEALVLLQVHRDRLPSTGQVVDRFAACGSRRLDCRLPLISPAAAPAARR
ncbi:repressor of the inhibitor of the protein kinase [Amphibalanus amphitrite]|uniref:Repressor of the inhibitor of the protein kinase n=1 Tax=Amphibalanus amphitrite TaxID=1232801 RepID=A0A6A4VMS9_AMPAM|nr:repressor of the inhibitor of the protein kinase [Amphibalanus amphitrite]